MLKINFESQPKIIRNPKFNIPPSKMKTLDRLIEIESQLREKSNAGFLFDNLSDQDINRIEELQAESCSLMHGYMQNKYGKHNGLIISINRLFEKIISAFGTTKEQKIRSINATIQQIRAF